MNLFDVLRKIAIEYSAAKTQALKGHSLASFIRKEIPEIALRTTFLVGHPGEGQKEFDELKKFVQDFIQIAESIPENSKQRELIKYMGETGANEVVDVLIKKWDL